ncbi:MAG: [FeFe] hydrogenase H-cluster radical SAM maturase HydE [Coriobacteriales bacterium]|nr:[FeFe] hydrogenase H-cluster radical SAM maturase HydE [Coriobacteriales bacterium]
MDKRLADLVGKLESDQGLLLAEYAELIDGRTPEVAELLAERARAVREPIYGRRVFTRGLIEISNVCKNDCLYCGIRCSNRNVKRYRLDPDTIVACARAGWEYGYRTIVLQGGEDKTYYADDVLCDVIARIVQTCPDTAVTVSMGERGRASFERMYDAGATRYLLRHETATREHYERLHPANMSFDHRMQCLYDLREIGYQVGAGMMVGSPFQTTMDLARDLAFIQSFRPDMCGIGPFIPHHDTPFAHEPAGTLELTLYLLSIIRLIHPRVLLPATTALGTIDPLGREKGMEAGANVVMPNLSPVDVRKQYELYDNKICTGDESAVCRGCLARRMAKVGYELVVDRGDVAR